MPNPLIIDVGEVLIANRSLGESNKVQYDTPRSVCTAVSIKTAYTKGRTQTFESGVTVFNRPYVSNADVTVQTHTLGLKDKMALFYSIMEPNQGTGYDEGTDTDKPAEVALGYWYPMSDGSFYCVWWYDASAQPADEGGETSSDSGPQLTPDDIIFSCVRDPILRKRRRVAIVKDEAARAAFFANVLPTQV